MTQPKSKMTKVISTDHESSVQLAADLLAQGHVIAVPTDTVYGLACAANNPTAMLRLYAIKGREETKPVAICVGEIHDLKYYGMANHLSDAILRQLLPGPVTLVLRKSQHLDNPYLNPGVEKIGIRIPAFDFIRNVSKRFNLPIALTSANSSGAPSTLNVEEFKNLWPLLGGVFNGGQLGLTDEQRAASTVIDLSNGLDSTFRIIREGMAVKQTLRILDNFGFRQLDT
jgi:tRNA threonylcarbamoyl adenosine modification protein (Sua5/YciO/YrdC/YwlC family)